VHGQRDRACQRQTNRTLLTHEASFRDAAGSAVTHDLTMLTPNGSATPYPRGGDGSGCIQVRDGGVMAFGKHPSVGACVVCLRSRSADGKIVRSRPLG